VARTPTTVHRLKVTLRHVTPPVWRRIEVRSNIELSALSDVLEGAMGWYGGHLHAFESNGVTHERHAELLEWLPPDFDPEAFDVDEATEAMRSPRPLQDWD
jgi:hypothetical protein